MRDFNLEGLGINDGSIDGSYIAKQSLNGTVTYANSAFGQTLITTRYDPDYELTPNANLVAGTYSGSIATAGGTENLTVTLSAAGAISGSGATGCSFTGSFAPRPHGNVFNVAVTFAGGVCSNGTNTVNGVAFFDAGTKRLYSAALNGSRTNGFLFIGTMVPPAAPLTITTTSLPNGTVNQAYNRPVQASGGTPPLTWNVVAGAGTLPQGLNLNQSTGAISGTPTITGTSSFTVRVADTGGQSDTQALSITISQAPVSYTHLTLPTILRV